MNRSRVPIWRSEGPEITGVLYVTPYPVDRITGIGRFVLDLSKKLSAQGIHTIVLSPRRKHQRVNETYVEITLQATHFANLELAIKTAARMFSARRKFQIVHVQQAHLQSLAACLVAHILGKPCVLTLHLKVPRPLSPLRATFQSFVERASVKAATVAVAVGKPVSETYGNDRVLVIDNGVDTELFRPRPEVRARLRNHLGLEDQFVFAFAGRWARSKGFDILVKALKSTALGKREFRTVVFGDKTPDEPTLIEDVLSPDGPPKSLQIVGPVEDLHSYLNVADVFVIPSRFEGMPLGFLEALATGVPVLASDIPVHVEVSQKTGCVWTFQSGNASALAQAMSEIIDQGVPESWKQSARMGAIRHYSLDRVVVAYVNLYRKARNRGRESAAIA